MVAFEVQSEICIMRFSDGRSGLLDAADIAMIQNYAWAMDAKGRIIANVNGKTLNLARFILAIKDRFLYADHINGNPADNRRCNLRVATPAENRRNSRTPKGRSLPKGVYKNSSGSYSATLRICEHGFETPEEAALAYNRIASRFHGEFARLNRQSEAEYPNCTDKSSTTIPSGSRA